MMLNENPMPPSDAVVEAITDIAKKGHRYPDRAYRLREKLGKLHGVAARTSPWPTARPRPSTR